MRKLFALFLFSLVAWIVTPVVGIAADDPSSFHHKVVKLEQTPVYSAIIIISCEQVCPTDVGWHNSDVLMVDNKITVKPTQAAKAKKHFLWHQIKLRKGYKAKEWKPGNQPIRLC